MTPPAWPNSGLPVYEMSSIDRRRAAAIALGDEVHHKAVDLVRHFEHMVIGYSAFGRVAVEQRRPRLAANDQREFPSDIGRVHKRLIQSLAAEWTRQVSGIAKQKAPPVAQALSGPHVHFEIRNPLQIVQTNVDADAGIEQRPELAGGRKFGPRIGLKLPNC